MKKTLFLPLIILLLINNFLLSQQVVFDGYTNYPLGNSELQIEEDILHVRNVNESGGLCIELPSVEQFSLDWANIDFSNSNAQLHISTSTEGEQNHNITFRAEDTGVNLTGTSVSTINQIELYQNGELVYDFFTEDENIGQIENSSNILGFSLNETGALWLDLTEPTIFQLPDGEQITTDEIGILPQVASLVRYTDLCIEAQQFTDFQILFEDGSSINPQLETVEPAEGEPGDEILLRGLEITYTEGVFFGDQSADFYPEDEETLRVIVPEGAQSNQVRIAETPTGLPFSVIYRCKSPEFFQATVIKKQVNPNEENNIIADVEINWSPVKNSPSGNTVYQLRHRQQQNSEWQIITLDQPNYTILNQDINLPFYYVVGAICEDGTVNFSNEQHIELGYGSQVEVSEELMLALENLPDDEKIQEHLLERTELSEREINSFLIDYYNGFPSSGTRSVNCHCKPVAVLPRPHITSERNVARRAYNYASKRKRKRKTINYNYTKWGAAARFTSYTRSKRVGNYGYAQDFADEQGTAFESRITLLYLCSEGSVASSCGCEKEVLVDGKYNSRIDVHTQIGTRRSHAKVEATDYATLIRYDGSSSSASNLQILAGNHKSVYAYNAVSWNDKFFETAASLAGNIAELFLGTVTSGLIGDIASDIGTLWGTPLNNWEGSSGSKTSYLTTSAFTTITIQPNIPTRLEWIQNIKVSSYGDSRSHRWYHGRIDIGSDYHLAVIINPAGDNSPVNCCVERTAGWIGGSLTNAPNNLSDVYFRIGDFLGYPYEWNTLAFDPSNLHAIIHHHEGFTRIRQRRCAPIIIVLPDWNQVASLSNNRFIISWIDRSDEVSFSVEVSKNNPDAFIEVATVERNATSIILNNIEDGNTYYVRLRAQFADGTFSEYTSPAIINKNTALSVDLTQFDAISLVNNTHQLSWITNDDNQYSSFVIERSTNGKQWSDIGKILATNNKQYTFIDQYPLNGVNYYRLRLNAIDGHAAYSNTRFLKTKTARIQIHPNISTGLFNIENNDLIHIKKIQLFNQNGQLIEEFNKNIISLDLTNYPKGIYYLKILMEEGIEVERLIKR